MSYGVDPPAKRRITPEALTEFRFIKLPVHSADGWRWDPLEIRQSNVAARGLGLFATREVKAGLLLPYTGKLLDDQWERCLKCGTEGRSLPEEYNRDYVVSLEDMGGHVDGNPSLPECAEGYCAAAFTNEAQGREQYNCAFVELSWANVHTHTMPRYRQAFTSPEGAEGEWSRELCNFLLVCNDLKKDEELLVYYGSEYHDTPGKNYPHVAPTVDGDYSKIYYNPEQYRKTLADWDRKTQIHITFPTEA